MKRFSEQSGVQKALEVVRWIAVLPAAYVASHLPFPFLTLFRPPAAVPQTGVSPAGAPLDLRWLIMTGIVIPFGAAAFVLAGSLTGPRLRQYVAVALAALFSLLALLSHVLLRSSGTPNFDHFAAAAAAAWATAGVICYVERRRA
jgi:hypothetical protein